MNNIKKIVIISLIFFTTPQADAALIKASFWGGATCASATSALISGYMTKFFAGTTAACIHGTTTATNSKKINDTNKLMIGSIGIFAGGTSFIFALGSGLATGVSGLATLICLKKAWNNL